MIRFLPFVIVPWSFETYDANPDNCIGGHRSKEVRAIATLPQLALASRFLENIILEQLLVPLYWIAKAAFWFESWEHGTFCQSYGFLKYKIFCKANIVCKLTSISPRTRRASGCLFELNVNKSEL